ncbi:NADPH:quinone reductase-like Zn-dependent oxidoreductase [Paenibacillus forsythiae]|uniref:NADPH:quinone reductase-like Zn-dependent oxidoreductase n=1 Tax=Paenibacillus forsythiae TaxID=365616 RepID=A0ABU3H4Y3_9BACL|nr:NADP-dependent oxidoreductase [Paenibacillus forsythiae]MDT3425889.1 NADPH:quinone reductase-like Zn-dependent oxidoreductase [Paenibacillus forsythiae]
MADVETMKAIRYHSHGGPEVLELERVERPQAAGGEVLVKVHAIGVNPGDWQIRSGLAGDTFPLPYIPGWDVSGVVAAVGPDASLYREGEAVYGMTANSGACAEYVVIPESQLARKPESLSHLQAAAVPMSAFTAWHALVKQGQLTTGQTVLIHGASGGVGHFAVQIAKLLGAKVIGVASGRNQAFLRELGADECIDYTVTPLTQLPGIADLVLDTVGGPEGDTLLAVLKPGGRLVPVTYGHYSADKAAELSIDVQDVRLLQIATADLERIGQWFDEDRLRVYIDTVVPLEETRQAHERSESRRARGKIVVQVIP